MTRHLARERDTEALGAQLAKALEPGLVVYLRGDLGAGKTTLARAILRGLGYPGKVKSPTYTLVELYRVSKLNLYHFDLYRFSDPLEWEDAGFRDYFNPESVCLVEWPEKGDGVLPPADLEITLKTRDGGRSVDVTSGTETGRRCIAQLEQDAAAGPDETSR